MAEENGRGKDRKDTGELAGTRGPLFLFSMGEPAAEGASGQGQGMDCLWTGNDMDKGEMPSRPRFLDFYLHFMTNKIIITG